jgi:putative redox protein
MLRAKLEWSGEGLTFSARSGTGHEILLRTTAEGGPTPMELLLIAVAGCTVMDVISILNKMKLDVSQFELDISGEQIPDYPKRYQKIELLYRIYGKEIKEERVSHAIELSQEKYCSVLASLDKEIEIKSQFEVIGKD